MIEHVALILFFLLVYKNVRMRKIVGYFQSVVYFLGFFNLFLDYDFSRITWIRNNKSGQNKIKTADNHLLLNPGNGFRSNFQGDKVSGAH